MIHFCGIKSEPTRQARIQTSYGLRRAVFANLFGGMDHLLWHSVEGEKFQPIFAFLQSNFKERRNDAKPGWNIG